MTIGFLEQGTGHNIVNDEHTACILSIQLSGSSSEDTLVWRHDGSGEYEVKSGYNALIIEHFLSTNYISPSNVGFKDFYRSL